MKNTSRDSNFELLRVLSMLAIVAGYFAGQSGLFLEGTQYNQYIGILFGSGSRIAVSLFLMIGMWFMVNTNFRIRRFFSIWTESIFWTVSISLIMLIISPNFTILKQAIKGFLPIFGGSHWFISLYLVLILLSPFLQKIKNTLTLKEQKILLFILLTYYGINTLIIHKNDYYDSIPWFITIYFLIGYLKITLLKNPLKNPLRFLLSGFLIYFLLVTFHYLNHFSFSLSIINTIFNKIDFFALYFLSDFRSLPNVLCALLIFCFFRSINIGRLFILNLLATGSLSVYIIHQIPAFYNFLWCDIFMASYFSKSNFYFFYFIGVIITTYLCGFLLGLFLKKIIYPIVENKCINILNKIDNISLLSKTRIDWLKTCEINTKSPVFMIMQKQPP